MRVALCHLPAPGQTSTTDHPSLSFQSNLLAGVSSGGMTLTNSWRSASCEKIPSCNCFRTVSQAGSRWRGSDIGRGEERVRRQLAKHAQEFVFKTMVSGGVFSAIQW